VRDLQELQNTLESKIRANIQQDLGQVVESAVTVALEKALPDRIHQPAAADRGGTSAKIKKLPRPRTADHNEFKVDGLSVVAQGLIVSDLEVHSSTRTRAFGPSQHERPSATC